jgi:hypothetical protein
MLDIVTEEWARNAVEVAGRHADGLVSGPEWQAAVRLGEENEMNDDLALRPIAALLYDDQLARYAYGHVEAGIMNVHWRSEGEAWRAKEPVEYLAHCQLLRDILGNPFRQVTLNPAWQTSTVTALAQAIYTDRAFDRLPILADALEDAGCDNADILNHCRQPSPTEHVRGCWVVDLVLGKS